MEFTSDQQYLHYSKSGFIYYFHCINKDVYVKTIKNNEVYATVKISENVTDYCIDIDNLGRFHLVSISSSGDLKYCIYRDNKWDCRYLTKYDAKSYQFKNLKLFIVNDHIHILMAISNIIHSELWTLKHHYWNTQSWINEKVCDIITEKYDLPFHVDIDPHNNMHIVFKSLYDKKYQIYYCKYNYAYHSWSIPTKISNLSQDNTHPFILCDNTNGAHIAWSGFYNNNLGVFYLYNPKINSSKPDWSEVKKISSEGANSTHPFIFQVENNIEILWKQNNKYFNKSKNILDNTWSESTKIELDPNHKLSSISVIGNIYKSWSEIKIPITYGLLANHEFFIIGLDAMPFKDYSQSTQQEYMFRSAHDHQTPNKFVNIPKIHSSSNVDADASTPLNLNIENEDIEQESEENNNTEILDINDQLIELIPILQDIRKEQEAIRQLLSTLNKQQEITVLSIEELTQLYSKLEQCLKSTNNNLFLKFKNLFK
ncbi:hypothetical protein [Marinisporobacter balticus]|uniref:Uncharacterized protein n=1 Tax=Marinisporobacter balticus TaxID=2018667 RepID=A0A4R2L8N0_9FIRM|nr:hypothetical protein [Marinisporobacter balticus]TCO79058.1 hypothetical protein EV214_103109 [Marinisporobacter balticus]